MSALTGVLYAALLVYLGGWLAGAWAGNFALLLFILSVVTGGYWLAERFRFKPAREAAAKALDTQTAERAAALAAQGIARTDLDVSEAKTRLLMQPWWLDWTAGLFPVIIGVFVLRSFLFEPFKIPSSSMVPTLVIGDLILVNKFHYGIRLPVLNKKIISINEPKRGDVMVFRFPGDTRMDYIKRVVGIPGDEVSYINQQLFLNGKPVVAEMTDSYYDEDVLRSFTQFKESLGPVKHNILVDPRKQAFFNADMNFAHSDQCKYSAEGVTCKVPAGHYFMMGDNRDNSRDSRYWGFVPDENIVGKAFFVWMNFGRFNRIGSFE